MDRQSKFWLLLWVLIETVILVVRNYSIRSALALD